MIFIIIGWETLWVGVCTPERKNPVRFMEVERSSTGLAFQAI
jgi:hypothetical protein